MSFDQGGSNIVNAQRTCRYDHPVAFSCHVGSTTADPEVEFWVNFICERLNVKLTAPQGPGLYSARIRTDVLWGRKISGLCTPTRHLKVPLGIGEERHQKGGWSAQWRLESGLLLPLYGLEL